MSDEPLRSFERAYLADPKDPIALERLQDERVRRGLGWHGEEVPRGVRIVRSERGVYAKPIHVPPAGPAIDGPVVEIQLVYVPTGEVRCETCRGSGCLECADDGQPRPDLVSPRSHRPAEHADCPDCRDGKRPIAPFYFGRFPAMWGEWIAFAAAEHEAGVRGRFAPFGVEPQTRGRPGSEYFPVTNVSLEEAKAFCSWTGLRLPSEAEWRWAALGDGMPSLDAASPKPWSTAGMTSRCFPWGNEPPSPERCVWRYPSHHAQPTTQPVVEWMHVECLTFVGPRPETHYCPMPGKPMLVPARTPGRSWCGAHDMAGNVREWIVTGDRLGCGYRDQIVAGVWPREIDHRGEILAGQPQDDVGFRVVLSA